MFIIYQGLRIKPLILWYLTNKIYDASLPLIRYVTRSQLKHEIILRQFSSIKRSEEMQLWNVSSWEFVKYMMTNNNFIIGAIWQTFKNPVEMHWIISSRVAMICLSSPGIQWPSYGSLLWHYKVEVHPYQPCNGLPS